ncbi:MAG: beta-ketoacyl-ACP synthase 3 [Planctomycetes bacterium]|nr:beta-ketoacyl-ACP synthase 3 [Planctomycetota bacterium]
MGRADTPGLSSRHAAPSTDALPRIGILGVGGYLPPTELTNRDLERIVETSDEWILRRTGIRSRRVLAENESFLDMAVTAAERAIEDAGIRPDQIGDIRAGTNTWMRFPGLATQVQARIGARQAAACDVQAGCSGFLYALDQAYTRQIVDRLRHGRDTYSLVIGADALSHMLDYTDRNTCVLMGDGAGAVVVGEVDAGGILATTIHAQGQFGDLLYSPEVCTSQIAVNGVKSFTHEEVGPRPYVKMNGKKVYPVAIATMVRDVRKVLEIHNANADEPITLDDIDLIIPHQANLRIIEGVAEKLGASMDRVYTRGVIEYGNTSAGTIPLAYVDAREVWKTSDRRRYEIDVAFGAGFCSGAILREVAPVRVARDSQRRSSLSTAR